MKSTKRLFTRSAIVLLLLFVALLCGLRWFWYEANKLPDQPFAEQGVLDLRSWPFAEESSIQLDGEWAFYPEQLLTRDQLASADAPQPVYLRVPGDWREGFADSDQADAYGYGTYRLLIHLNPEFHEPYGLWVQSIQAASQLEINGRPETMFGEVAETKSAYRPENITYTASIVPDEDTLELLVRVANYDQPSRGGIIRPIRFGSQATIDNERMYSIGFQLIAFVVMLLHALYAGILFLFNRRNTVLLIFFGLLCMVGLSIIADHDLILQLWLPINYTWLLKIRLLAYLGVSLFMLLLAFSFATISKPGLLFRLYAGALAGFVAFILFGDVSSVYYVYANFHPMLLLYVLPLAGVVGIIVKLVARRVNDAIYLLLAALCILSSVGWGVFVNQEQVRGIYYPVDMVGALICFSAYWFKRYFRNSEEKRRLNMQLRLADRQKDEFLANTSHELRTPLHGIMNIAQAVVDKEGAVMREQSRKDMDLLITLSRRMTHMLGDLLDAVRLQERRIVLRREPVRIQSAAAGVLDMLSFMTDDKPVELRMEVATDFPPVYADENRLVQILFNLLHNAVKYTDRGTVAVTAEREGKQALIRVADTGRGMDDELLERVFERYVQGRPGEASGGIGLGLHIASQLAHLHEGGLEIESTPGTGTVITLRLPLAAGGDWGESIREETVPEPQPILSAPYERDQAAVSIWSPLERRDGSPRQLRILAVDDDPVNLKVLVGLLAHEHCHVHTVKSGEAALALAASEPWDLMIVDVMMPGMSGYELTRRVRERFRLFELPILLLTARSGPEDVSAGFMAGANDYVTKPVEAMELRFRAGSLTALKQSVHDTLRLEAAYLQAQIQPHFLFNTLNSIAALSEFDVEKMQALIEAFAAYLRISFNFLNVKEVVPFRHELELVQAYLYIEQERFGERLSVVLDVEAAVGLTLPPLTLQPLVENAVRHGLMSRSRGGTVTLRATRITSGVLLEIADDGVGMPEHKAAQLVGGDEPPQGGIGLYNTDRRLKQRYGQGLSLRSQPGEGTVVSFVIPLPVEGDEEGAV